MLNNKDEAKLWDKKYSQSREYKTVDDIFRFCSTNPTLKEILPLIHNRKGFKVLEIGSGTGELIFYVKNKNQDIEACGIDFSEESIRRSKEISRTFNLNVTFEKGDIARMPYPDQSFDIVYGDQVIGHVEDKEKVLKEIYRVTKKGGIIALTIGNALRPDGWYLNTKLSKSHQGYRQKNMFPWILRSYVEQVGFESITYYGDMVFLFRNISLIRSLFIKKTNIHTVTSSSTVGSASKNIYKQIYHWIESIFPPWAKITVGTVARKM